MLTLFGELIRHQEWADETILKAVRDHEPAAEDRALRKALHHIVVTQRAFLSLFLSRAFDVAKEMKTPESLEGIEELFREAHADLARFVRGLDEGQLEGILPLPWIEGARPAVKQALMQVVMHSQHHRGQAASRLRELGGKPPMVDYILWVRDQQKTH
jgi:uncharacterized damage-inducible protein DinB